MLARGRRKTESDLTASKIFSASAESSSRSKLGFPRNRPSHSSKIPNHLFHRLAEFVLYPQCLQSSFRYGTSTEISPCRQICHKWKICSHSNIYSHWICAMQLSDHSRVKLVPYPFSDSGWALTLNSGKVAVIEVMPNIRFMKKWIALKLWRKPKRKIAWIDQTESVVWYCLDGACVFGAISKPTRSRFDIPFRRPWRLYTQHTVTYKANMRI